MARLKLSPRNWTLVKSTTKIAQKLPNSNKLQQIKPVAFKVNIPICVALIESKSALSHWWLAGWCQAYFYSGAFVARQLIGIKSWKLGLSRPMLLNFKSYEAQTYGLEFSFPKYYRDITLKVWQYNGQITDATDRDLKQLIADIAKIDGISVNET